MNTQKQRKLLFKNSIKYIIILTIILSSFNSHAFEQDLIIKKDTITTKSKNKYTFPLNSFYFEFAGLGGLYSLNYEISLYTNNNNNISFRTGMCYFQLIYSGLTDFVFQIKYNRFLLNKLMLNMGIGFVIWESTSTKDNSFDSVSHNGTVFSNELGISFVPNSHFLLKASTLLFYSDNTIKPYWGLSIGFKFGKSKK